MKEYSDNYIELFNELHSQKLRECYGEISLQVIKQDGLIRTSYLRDKDHVIRTFAITLFSDKLYSAELNNIHSQVIGGDFIGESIRAHGFDVIKRIKGKFKLIASESSVFNERNSLYGQLSEIFVSKNEKNKEFYAEICEIYDSDFNHKYNIIFDLMHNPGLVSRIERIIRYVNCGNIEITLID